MFRPNAPIKFHTPQFPIARIAFRQLIHITINSTGIYIRCKSTKNTKHDRSIGSKPIKYIMFVVLLKK